MTKKQIRVSILVPVYGVEKYIARCATSLMEQTYPTIEYIFVDDCSPDKSIKILNNTLKKYPQRADCVKIITHSHNKGLAAARNTAVKAATGDFVMHVDSDDWINIDTVEECVRKQRDTEADIVRFGMKQIHFKGYDVELPTDFSSTKEMCIAVLQRETIVCVWGGLYKRTLYTKNNIWAKEGINISEDYSVTPRLAYYAKRIAVVSKALYNYNMTNLDSYIHSVDQKAILQNYGALEILHNFFDSKDEIYHDALERGEYKIMVHLMKNTSQDSNLRKYFLDIRKRISRIKPENRKGLSAAYRIIPMLHYYWLVRIYINTIRMLRQNRIYPK